MLTVTIKQVAEVSAALADLSAEPVAAEESISQALS